MRLQRTDPSAAPGLTTPGPVIRIGDRFDRLVVLGEAGRTPSQKRRYLCRCDCGEAVNVVGASLKRGFTRSCGCLKREVNAAALTIHGHAETPTWVTWTAMKTRCLNPNATKWPDYGGRGITICGRWQEPQGQGFVNFLADMGERPEGMSIDRIDPDGNYEPSNCRWATASEQARNKRPRLDVT